MLQSIVRIVEPDKLTSTFGRFERSLISAYNAKPILTRPHHHVHKTGSLFQLDVDVHKWAVFPRKGIFTFKSLTAAMRVDCAFVIEGIDDDELPELLLGSLRVCHPNLDAAPLLQQQQGGDE